MNKTDFQNSVTRYLAGNATPEEEKQLLQYYRELQEKELSWNENNMGIQEDVKNDIYYKALDEIARREKNSKNKIRDIFSGWRVAAAIIAIISIAAYFHLSHPDRQLVKKINRLKPVQNDVLPGGNKAVLTLADGTQIVLDNARDGALASQGNIAVSKSKDGQLVYQVKKDQPAENMQPSFNTIRTPVSGQYQVTLSDDTKVWLNANSSLKFPTVFTGDERSVEIEGEAYFEVAKDKKRPFKVMSNGQVIEVLGTHFNVNAYNDEAETKTTLVEGSVKIVSGTSSKIIKPGQQARVSHENHTMDIASIDPEGVVSWKNGLFVFDNEDIHSIMRKISRWYGVEIVFQNDEINERFGGTISRFENVSQVLKLLEVTETIHFKIEGRRITVMK